MQSDVEETIESEVGAILSQEGSLRASGFFSLR